MDRFTTGIVAAIILLLIAAIGAVALGLGRAEPADPSTPHGVVLIYLREVRSGGYDAAYGLLSSSLQSKVSREEFIQAANYLNGDRQRLDVSEGSVDGDRALVPVIYASPGSLFDNYSYTRTAALVREGGQWRISAPTEPYLPIETPR